jgi:hypothetical protein
LLEVPWPRKILAADRLKLGAYIPSARGAVTVCLPEVPVIVRGYWPTAAALVAVSVRMLVELAGFCENAAVTPLGRPEMERLTLPLNPYCEFT